MSLLKKVITLILFSALIFCGILLIKADEKTYYYNNSILNLYPRIPFDVKLIFRNDFEGGSFLGDSSEMSIVRIGENKFRDGKTIYISKFTQYGYSFSKNKVVAEVYNNSGKKKYIEWSNDPYSNDPKIIEGDNFNSNAINWIKIDYWSYYDINNKRDDLLIMVLIGIILLENFIIFFRK